MNYILIIIFFIREREINRYDGKITKETDNENLNKLLRKLIQVDIEKRII